MELNLTVYPAWHSAMFDDHADVFNAISEHRADTGVLIQFLSNLLPQSALSLPLLDAGCGTGRHTASLAKLFPLVIGVDKSHAMLEIAQSKNSAIPNCIFLHDDFQIPHFLPCQFGVILKCYTSVGYFPETTELEITSRFYNMLRPGGYCILDTFNGLWLAQSEQHVRNTTISDIELQETYRYAPKSGNCLCNWKYSVSNRAIASIDFNLGIYDHTKMRTLMQMAGFVDIHIYSGYSEHKHLPTDSSIERLVCVGRKG
jgi:SAM-dependent methyltransferase